MSQVTRPIAVAAIETPRDMCDINLTPDKRRVMMQYEEQLMDAFDAVRDLRGVEVELRRNRIIKLTLQGSAEE